MKNQGPSGEAADMMRLYGLVDFCFSGGSRSKSISDVGARASIRYSRGYLYTRLHRSSMSAASSVSVRNSGYIIALFQILAHGLVIGEVAIVHQGLVECAERMAAAGMPHAAAGRDSAGGRSMHGP